METILVVLDSRKLENPDLDIRYELPDKVERYTHNEICDNGYDYITNAEIGIWFKTKSAKGNYGKLLEFFDNHMVCCNDLAGTAKVYISDKETASIEECTLVYDGEEKTPDRETRAANRAKKVNKIILKIAEILMKDDKAVLGAEILEGDDKDVSGGFTAGVNNLVDTAKQWQSFSEILTKHHYILECDMVSNLDDFLKLIAEMAVVKINNLMVNKEDFDADSNIYKWCGILDGQWEEEGFCMATFELEDCNDVIFPCNMEKLEELRELAGEIGLYFEKVSEM